MQKYYLLWGGSFAKSRQLANLCSYSVIITVLQYDHIHSQTAQVPPKSLQHVVAHHPQLLGTQRGGVFEGLLATQEAFLFVNARVSDPLSPLTFLNGQRQ